MTWQKGQSGNPGGRPKSNAEARELAQAHTADAIAALVAIVSDDSKPPAARVTAAIALLDRAHGKPAATVNTTVSSGESLERFIELINTLTDDQIAVVIERSQQF